MGSSSSSNGSSMSESRCRCVRSRSTKVVRVRIIKVPLMGAALDGGYEVVRDTAFVLTLGFSARINGGLKDSSHEAVEITLENCAKCNAAAKWTLHFGKKGKKYEKAYYTKVYSTVENCDWFPSNLTLGRVNDKYSRMQNSGYCAVNFNCSHWAHSLYDAL